jgi:diguanylate cyclase (GGDEF)-like protein
VSQRVERAARARILLPGSDWNDLVGRQAAVVRLLFELLPGGVVLLAAWGLQQSSTAQAAIGPAAPYFCFGSLASALFLSWYYDQSRLLYCAAVVALTVVAFDQPSFVWTALPLTAAILLPVNFALFGLLKERGVMTFDGLVEAGVVVAQVVGMPWIAGQSGVAGAWFQWNDPPAAARLPWFANWSFALGALVIGALILRRRGALEKGMLWALVAMLVGFHQQTAADLRFYAGMAGLFLAYGVLEHGRDLAFRDDLTGLPGRRAFNSAIEQTARPYAVAICDVDHFKKFNDSHGHDAGDQVLRMVAARLRNVGGGGRAYRYGGEEFLILFRGRTSSEVLPQVEALRREVAEAGFTPRSPRRPAAKVEGAPPPTHPVAPRVTITISIGLADTSKDRPTPDLVLDAADLAMYQAKDAGRNCVRVFP